MFVVVISVPRITMLLLILFSSFGHHGGVSAQDGSTSSCYNSTMAILMGQLEDPPIKTFTICPNTTINIGIPASADFSEFSNGDIPLTIVQDDVTIRCGEDGDPSNSCTLFGGFTQVVTIPSNPFVPDRIITTDNLKLQGLTFTGQLVELPGLLTVSTLFSASGTGMVMENCDFLSIQADIMVSNAVSVLATTDSYPPFSSDLSIVGCSFMDITYGSTLVKNNVQTMNIEDAIFDNVRYQDCGCEGPIALVENIGGTMEMTGSNFSNLDVVSAVAYWNSTAPADAVSTFQYLNNQDAGGLVAVDAGNRSDYCEDGLLKTDVDDSMECLNLFVEGGEDAAASLVGFHRLGLLYLTVGLWMLA
jgi:hypothetical protein